MTPLTGADGQASRAASAPPQTPAGHRQRSLAGVLAYPRPQLEFPCGEASTREG
jgi:hypothetical protein